LQDFILKFAKVHKPKDSAPKLINALMKFFGDIDKIGPEHFLSKNVVFDITGLRIALADLYPESTRFEMGEMCDASEALDEILTQIGISLSNSKQIEKGKFRNMVGFELTKCYLCACGKKNEFPMDPN
jgi:hypothetical protein